MVTTKKMNKQQKEQEEQKGRSYLCENGEKSIKANKQEKQSAEK